MINIDINDYREEKSCIYKCDEYLVRDNGAVLRKPRQNEKIRKHDNEWTFGIKNNVNGYSFFFGSNIRIHPIVATAFYGDPQSKDYIVDHIDGNRQNNRPSNLRWVTREENTLKNELTRRKIEYITGVSVEEFLENPKKYRDYFGKPNVTHMRPVTNAEAIAYSINVQKLGKSGRAPINKQSSKLENWIYNIRDPYIYMEDWNSKDFSKQNQNHKEDSASNNT